MKRNLRLLTVALLLLSTACQAAPTPTPVPTPIPVPSPTLPPTPVGVPTPVVDWQDLAPYRAATIPEAQADIDALTNPTRYFIDLVVDVENLTLTGSERVRYTNNEAVDLEEVYFRLFPNVPGYGGAMEIHGTIVNGEEAQVIYELDDSALKIPLAQPLAPGEQLDITLDFLVRVPRGSRRQFSHYSYGVLTMTSFYPMVPVYDDEGWNIEIAPGYGEAVYSDTSLYLVELTVPQEMVVATSGSVIARVDSGDGTTTLTCASGPMRDFTIVMSDKYQVVSTTVGETTVNSYYLPDHEVGGVEFLEYASESLLTYNELFGIYPFSEFDVVETGTAWLGVEYPGLIEIQTAGYDKYHRGTGWEQIVAHEVAHQWWYSLVGSDPVDEPWLDESLTQYSSLIYFEKVRGKGMAENYLKSFLDSYQRVVEEGRDAVVAQPVAAFSPDDYLTIVYYSKGPLFFHSLRQQVGDDTYFEIMREYLRQHKYRIATGESLLAVAEEVSGQDLDEIYHRWILSVKREKPTPTAAPPGPPAPHPGWITYTTKDGLASNRVMSIAVAPDGTLWFGTCVWWEGRGGVSRFDGETWTTHTTKDGLVDNIVFSIAVAPDGRLWFGTAAGVSRFDEETWTTYTVRDGLAGIYVWSVVVAPDGALWFGTWGDGVSRFDGETWTNYTTDDGLAHNDVLSIAVAPDGGLWFGTRGGVSRFDGETWTNYTEDDGLADNVVKSVAVAPDGAVWCGTFGGGVSRFDGETWTTYTTEDGLVDNGIESIAVAPDGALWFGTWGGVSRFDGETWTNYTTDEGLVDNVVESVVVGPDGALWFGTHGGGVSRYLPPD